MTVLASPRAISNSTIRINYSTSLKIQNPQNQPLQPDEQMVLLITEMASLPGSFRIIGK